MVLRRAELLDPEDRLVLEQVLGNGVAAKDVAMLSGRSPRSVQRQVRALMERLTDERVVAVLRQHHQWDPTRAAVAMAVWVRGWTLRRTAGELGLSLHRVREHVAAIRGMLEESGSGERADRGRWREAGAAR